MRMRCEDVLTACLPPPPHPGLQESSDEEREHAELLMKYQVGLGCSCLVMKTRRCTITQQRVI